MPALKPLFGYGTFRRTAWRDAILGASYPERPATLRGYRRIACASGYLSLRETLFDVGLVSGVLVELDELGWRIADRWEEVPKYRRTDVLVNSMSGPVEAVTYLCSDDTGAVPVDDDRLALIRDAEVEEAIERFGPLMRGLRRDAEGY
ncbi:MAG TPA: gamma-glutamylcyclotransferase family protein [Dongiaceae bacterium]|nr:gamma-glutamylcyclotransferase family protein [Dongiaceae bacterium]